MSKTKLTISCLRKIGKKMKCDDVTIQAKVRAGQLGLKAVVHPKQAYRQVHQSQLMLQQHM